MHMHILCHLSGIYAASRVDKSCWLLVTQSQYFRAQTEPAQVKAAPKHQAEASEAAAAAALH